MKTYSLLLIIFVATAMNAQVYEPGEQPDGRDIDKNELSLNAFNVLGFGVLDFSYERILDEHSSISAEVFANAFNLDTQEEVDLYDTYSKNFSFTTKYKYFFSESKTAWGFYTQLFGSLSTGNDYDYIEYVYYDEVGEPRGQWEKNDYFTDFALGVGVGYKYVAQEGFLVDVSFALGRNLFDKDAPNLMILPGINFGYRF